MYDRGAPLVGRDALLARREAGPQKRLVTLSISARDAPAHGGASVMNGKGVVGTVTSGDFGFRTGLNLALAFVEPSYAEVGSTVEVDMLGERVAATVIAPSPYDPEMMRPRS